MLSAFINHFSDIVLGIVCHIYKDKAVSCLCNLKKQKQSIISGLIVRRRELILLCLFLCITEWEMNTNYAIIGLIMYKA